MSKFAFKVRETYSDTIVVESDTYEHAYQKLENALWYGDLFIDEDNDPDTTISDDTDAYKQIFGEEYDKLEEDKRLYIRGVHYISDRR